MRALTTRQRTGVLVGALALVLAVVLVVVLTGRGSRDGAAPLASPSTGTSTAPSPSASPSPAPSAPSAEPTAEATPSAAAADPAASPTTGGPALDLAPAAAAVVDDVRQIESSAQHTDPVAPGTAVAPVTDVQVVVDSTERVDAAARGPGEVAGPALAVTLTVTNGTGAAVGLDDVLLNLYGTDGVPGSQNLGDDRSAPLSGQLAAGASATGTYVLTLPQVAGDSYVLSVSLSPTSPVVLVVISPEAG